MNEKQAKEILLRHRPGSVDENDPEVREALELAADAPDVAVWLAEHTQFQNKMKAEHQEIPVPEGLREQILSEIPSRMRSRRQSYRQFSAAVIGCLLVLVGGLLFLREGEQDATTFDYYRGHVTQIIQRNYDMEINTGEPSEVREFLKKNGAQSNLEIPPGLDGWPLLGGLVLKWHNQPSSMLCFGRDSQPQRWLFVVGSSVLSNPPADAKMIFARVGRFNTISWSSRGLTYVLAGETNDTELKNLVTTRG